MSHLKNLLRQRGLSCGGRKAQLIDRLLDAEGRELQGGKREAEETEGGKFEGEETEGRGAAIKDTLKRKAADPERWGKKRNSRPMEGYFSAGTDDNIEDGKAAGVKVTVEENASVKEKATFEGKAFVK